MSLSVGDVVKDRKGNFGIVLKTREKKYMVGYVAVVMMSDGSVRKVIEQNLEVVNENW